ncbi:MAG: hypothetical protein ACTSYX_04935 [Candidatus Thorarchaeota archaeon]
MSSEDWELHIISDGDAADWGIPEDQREVLVPVTVEALLSPQLYGYYWRLGELYLPQEVPRARIYLLEDWKRLCATMFDKAEFIVSPKGRNTKYYVVPVDGPLVYYYIYQPFSLRCPICGADNPMIVPPTGKERLKVVCGRCRWYTELRWPGERVEEEAETE